MQKNRGDKSHRVIVAFKATFHAWGACNGQNSKE